MNAEPVHNLAVEIARLLEAAGDLLVLAESCTGGLASGILARTPGISRFFCGSAVTYREDTKIRWLGVPRELIRRHTSVSEEVTRSMAFHVLQRTPEATLAAAITGHLGPDSPAERDGLVFVAVARRIPSHGTLEIVLTESGQLECLDRLTRQEEAVGKLLTCVRRALTESGIPGPVG